MDIRQPTDLFLLNEAREVADFLIDEMHPQVRERFGHKPRNTRKKARQQFLTVANKMSPHINKIRKAIKQQLGLLKRNLASIDALIACGGYLLAAGRHIYEKLLVISELVRSRSFSVTQTAEASLIASLASAKRIRPIVRVKARCNVEFGAKISISVTSEGLTYLDLISNDPSNEGEDLKAESRTYRRRF